LSHTNGVAVSKIVALDVSSETSESNAADHGLVGLSGSVTPPIVMVEAAVRY
jgi:hypothetical protein